MCRPIRTLTEAKGFDASLHNLASFGGAGGQHACDIARTLGISRVLVHKYSSVLSAHGMALADVVHEERSPSAVIYSADKLTFLADELDKLQTRASKVLLEQGIPESRIKHQRYLNMRFDGSDTALMIQERTVRTSPTGFLDDFKQAHKAQFGFLPVDRNIIVDDYRVRSIGEGDMDHSVPWPVELASVETAPVSAPQITKPIYFKGSGWSDTPVYSLGTLAPHTKIPGPALIMDDKQTILVVPQALATVLFRMVVIDIGAAEKKNVSSTKVDPIQLSIFGHRFMGVAEQMGRALQKTSVSVNIKERLDFSCTVFSPDGGLVANAPHVPAMVSSYPSSHFPFPTAAVVGGFN